MSDIYFADYRYNLSGMALYQNGYRVPLKPRQAQLLHLLLTRHKEIVSKAQILDEVWGDTVVSEQVIFQTISQLRALLGESAIHTYARLGYQWQWPITDTPMQSRCSDKRRVSPWRATTAVTALLLVCATCYVFFDRTSADTTSVGPEISVLTTRQSQNQLDTFSDIAAQAVAIAKLPLVQQTLTEMRNEQVFETPKRLWSQVRAGDTHWRLWGTVYAQPKGSFLHYGMTRPGRIWQGYVYAADPSDLAVRFAERLSALAQSGVFADKWTGQDDLALLTLSRQNPDDPEFILAAGRHYIDRAQPDLAMTYLDRLIEEYTDYQYKPYVALAHWHKGKIFKMRGQHTLATSSLGLMRDILTDTQLPLLKHTYVTTLAWLSFELGNWTQMNAVLEEALSEAKAHGRVLHRFELHILYSILASKTGQTEKQYQHLNLGQSVLAGHALDNSNQAHVLYLFALFSDSDADSVPYLRQLIALPRTGRNYWVQEDALARLVDFALTRGDYSEAHALLPSEKLNPRLLLLRAKVYLAQGQPERAMPVLKAAFKLAQQRFDGQSALKAALLLYRAPTSSGEEKRYYLAYLRANTGLDWLRHQQISQQELATL
ncbi:winged helix-turn-helix domain-containing protein [Pseudoalteromonas sp. OOF1S-7]|uniref:winged helix-turn-helix domain-containing protein n=1 Tax=Pseudoalteromonas sp. OOF1S-7 TaxID=2917757 RepID=UPI001EF60CB0|nr:winged helix-turn-helix domain-containing protein [Pseudoalteromonas sp. OOF1S-7]MCG7534199.1 winged helix-turn-helix domain-containing protein [Pseudoalteromonas sp. OOF1S-7]